MSTFQKVRAFAADHVPIGDRLGESVYAVWMGVVSIGLINAEKTITPDYVLSVVAIAFGVNLVWGLIDGITVMLTNVIDRRHIDVLVWRLRVGDDAAREDAAASLDDSIATVLGAAEKNRLIDQIAKGPAGDDPRLTPARAGADDWGYAFNIVLIDVLLVVPLVLPLVVLDDVHTAIFLSRIIAVTLFAALGAAYARNLQGRPLLWAVLLGAMGYALFTAAYAAGW